MNKHFFARIMLAMDKHKIIRAPYMIDALAQLQVGRGIVLFSKSLLQQNEHKATLFIRRIHICFPLKHSDTNFEPALASSCCCIVQVQHLPMACLLLKVVLLLHCLKEFFQLQLVNILGAGDTQPAARPGQTAAQGPSAAAPAVVSGQGSASGARSRKKR